MYDLLKPIYLTQKPLTTSLFISLGLTNIQQTSHCMSRIRITVSDPSLLTPDSTFLELQAKGVARLDNSIHLIFGQQSMIIEEQLHLLLKIFQHSSIISLLLALQGSRNINNMTLSDDQININYNSSLYLDIPLLQSLNSDTISIQNVNDHIEISTSDIKSYAMLLQYAILFWDLIQSVYIFNYIPINQITSIEQVNYDLHITTLKPVTVISHNWQQLGLSIEVDQLNPKTTILKNCSIELCETCLQYFYLHKTRQSI